MSGTAIRRIGVALMTSIPRLHPYTSAVYSFFSRLLTARAPTHREGRGPPEGALGRSTTRAGAVTKEAHRTLAYSKTKFDFFHSSSNCIAAFISRIIRAVSIRAAIASRVNKPCLSAF